MHLLQLGASNRGSVGSGVTLGWVMTRTAVSATLAAYRPASRDGVYAARQGRFGGAAC